MHPRRRTALSVSAALLLAAPLLSACSGEARPGTAAVVGGERITTSTLQAQVKDVRAAQQRTDDPAQQIAATTRLERVKLSRMVQLRVLERAADDAGITVTTKEIEGVAKNQLAQAGGDPAQLERLLLAQRTPLAPGQAAEEIRFQLLYGKLLDRYGEEQAMARLAAAAGQLHIEINPRYGAWDAKQITLGEGRTPWITQKTRTEEPQA
ncbi:SurA N-terminal domain-containing protein [Streptomyces sp. NPDC048603]|uniref:SurA N-terminal domain-containing protein n=1 Tax=Streptomyces sp. NPDC048603 TaxID=3365577 RepID=UPI00371F0E23